MLSEKKIIPVSFFYLKKMVKKRELLFFLMLCVQSCFLTVLVSAWSRALPSVFPSFSVLLEYGVVSMDGLCIPVPYQTCPRSSEAQLGFHNHLFVNRLPNTLSHIEYGQTAGTDKLRWMDIIIMLKLEHFLCQDILPAGRSGGEGLLIAETQGTKQQRQTL